MFSQGLRRCPHAGQCEGGDAMDSPLGTRLMTTLRNEPIKSPRMLAIAG